MADSQLSAAPDTKGSDEILELFCEACLKEGNKVEVCAYCIECDEYFCMLCQKYHTRFLKDHKILDADNMPKDVERCTVHKQIIKLYCSMCEKFACCMCTTHSSLTSAQKPCKFTPVVELSKNIEQSQELRNFIAKLDKSVSKSVQMKQNESELENIAAQAKQEVQKYKDKILAKAEKMNSEIDKRKQTDSAKVLTITAKSNALISKMEEVSKRIKQRYANVKTQRSQMFIAMKQMQSEIESLNKEMDEITTEMDKLKYIFDPDASIKYIIGEHQNYGTLLTKSEKTEREKLKMQNRKIAVLQYNILEKDRDILVINFCVLPGQLMAICDVKDDSVKLFNASQKSVIATRHFNSTPRAITFVGHSQFAVAQDSFNNENGSTVTFIGWSQKNVLYFKGKQFKVEGCCSDIIFEPDQSVIIVLLCYQSEVKILDMSGTILQTYDIKPLVCPESANLSRISWMALDKEQNILYITNNLDGELMVIHLQNEHDIVERKTEPFLSGIGGIAFGNQGSIYASFQRSNKIIVFNPNTWESQDVLTGNDGVYAPTKLKYCEQDDLLYVDTCNAIKVFKIIEKQCVWKETLQKVAKWEPI